MEMDPDRKESTRASVALRAEQRGRRRRAGAGSAIRDGLHDTEANVLD